MSLDCFGQRFYHSLYIVFARFVHRTICARLMSIGRSACEDKHGLTTSEETEKEWTIGASHVQGWVLLVHVMMSSLRLSHACFV